MPSEQANGNEHDSDGSSRQDNKNSGSDQENYQDYDRSRPYRSNHDDRRYRSGRRHSKRGSRSRSPSRDQYGRDRKRQRDYADDYKRHDDRRDYDYKRHDYRRERHRPRRGSYEGDEKPRSRRGGGGSSSGPRSVFFDELERAQRTVCCKQLASRLKDRELIKFFESHGCPVRDVSIVKDKRSNLSKGIAYVEFEDFESVAKAVGLTGEQLLGLPIVVEITEVEKNRQALEAAGLAPPLPITKEHQVKIGNLSFQATEDDLREAFQKFGTIDATFVYKTPTGKSEGYGVVNYASIEAAEQAKLEMEGFPLKGRPLSLFDVDKEKLSSVRRNASDRIEKGRHRHDDDEHASGGTASGGHRSGGGDDNFDGSSKNVSRTELMQRLMRAEDRVAINMNANTDTSPEKGNKEKLNIKEDKENAGQDHEQTQQKHVLVSPCVLIHNMFDPTEESGSDWIKELEEDVKIECEESYGKVKHLALDSASKGDVYVKFADVDAASRAISGLNGRWFGGKQLKAESLVEMVYYLK